MADQPYLIFALQQLRYAVNAVVVQEIFFLPELTPIPDAPNDIAGLMNLRGELLPVLDLSIRFEDEKLSYALTDSIIVFQRETVQFGLLVNQVYGVQNIDEKAIKTDLSSSWRAEEQGEELSTSITSCIRGIAQVEEYIVMLLDLEQLVHKLRQQSPALKEFAGDNGLQNRDKIPLEHQTNRTRERLRLAKSLIFSPHATPEEQQIFRERAQNLRKTLQNEDFAGLLPLAVIGLNREYFGVNLELIREFTDIKNITPIPCTPSHIIGNMNLRGEIITLVDIRNHVNLPLDNLEGLSKAMIVQVDELVVGVIVDDIFDVMYLNVANLKTIPTAVHGKQDEYLKGTAFYGKNVLSILDLPRILTQGNLVVDEEI